MFLTDLVSFKKFSCQTLWIQWNYRQLLDFQTVSLSDSVISLSLSLHCLCVYACVWCYIWMCGSLCCRGGVLPLGERAAARPLASASLKWRGHGYIQRYPYAISTSISPKERGNVLKSRSHMRTFCILFNCFTSSLKTDLVADVHLLVQVPYIRSDIATDFNKKRKHLRISRKPGWFATVVCVNSSPHVFRSFRFVPYMDWLYLCNMSETWNTWEICKLTFFCCFLCECVSVRRVCGGS